MSVATVYAKALFEAVAPQGQSPVLDRLEKELSDLAHVVQQSKELRAALFGPVANAKERTGIVEALAGKLGLSPEMTRFLLLLARKGRLSLLPDLVGEFTMIRLQAEGGIPGRLVAADPIAQQDVEALAQAFGKKLGKKVAFRVSTDPTLLAGVKVTVNGVTYDGTLRSQLQKLRDEVFSAGRSA